MNDGLRDAIEDAYIEWDRSDHAAQPVDYIEPAVRAFLSLPPSEEEIEAGMRAINPPSGNAWPIPREHIIRALVASRAVLVPPPEVAG